MKRSDEELAAAADLLFDLPLDPEPAREPAEPVPPQPAPDPVGEPAGGHDTMSLWDPEEAAESAYEATAPAAPTEPPLRWVRSPLQPRILAASLDLVALVVTAGLAIALLVWLDVPLSRAVALPLATFLASFSFVYFVVPLAFWGHTPGMAHQGLVARNKYESPLTIQQALFRWLGFLLAVGSVGLLGLLTLAGVSPADLISRSRVFSRG